MKVQRIIIGIRVGLLSTALLLGSCSGSDESRNFPAEEAVLRISGASVKLETAVTRGTTETLTQPTDAIGLFLKGDDAYDAIHNRKYTYGTPFWETETEQLVLGKTPAVFTAYYPYAEGGTTSVTLTSQAYDAGKEFYYLPFKASYMTSAITLNLRRAYSLVRFSFIKGEKDKPGKGDAAYGGPAEVSAFEYTAGLCQSGTLDLFTGIVSGSATDKTFTVSNPFTAGSSDTPVQKDYLIVPHAFSGDMTFSATVDNKEMKGKVSAAELCGTVNAAFMEGTCYEIKVYVRPTGLEVKTLRVKEWDATDIPGEIENI